MEVKVMIASDGKRRKHVRAECAYCHNELWKPFRFFRRGPPFYCNRKCMGLAAKASRVLVVCAQCGLGFEKQPSDVRDWNFCSKKCKDIAQRIGGIKEIQPSHYGNGKASYRDRALRELENKCCRCGYDRVPEILEVHHKDRNRDNNVISNLEMICPTCHQEEHFFSCDGKYGKRNGSVA